MLEVNDKWKRDSRLSFFHAKFWVGDGREAVLGGPVEVPTPTGRLRVTLPAHSDSGRQIRLRGKGVAAHGAEPAGDLLLTLKVVIGPADAALDAFLRDWSPAAMEDPRAALDFPA